MTSTIRSASLEDLRNIQKLTGKRVDVTTIPGRRHVLVLDDDNGQLAACAVLVLEGARGHLRFLAIAPGHDGEGLDERMLGVAESICEAFGATDLDVQERAA